MSIRDTKFQGFAKALLKDLVDDMLDEYGFMERSHYEDGDLKTAEELITRRAYDLVCHLLKNADSIDLDTSGEYLAPDDKDAARRIANMPDMPELPDDDKRYAEMQNAEEQDEPVSIYESLRNDEGVMRVAAQMAKGMLIMSEYIADNEMLVLPEGVELYDPNKQPRQISFTTSDGKKFEGIVYYAGEAKEQE